MAQIARRLWSELNTEAILAAGGHVYTGYSTRMQYWITEAYYDLAANYHHYPLDQTEDFSLAAGSTTWALPKDCYVVVGVASLDATTGQPARFLMPERPQTLFGHFRSSASAVKSYARIKNVLIFDSKNDAARQYRLYYYRTPNAPDFAATSGQPNSVSEFDWLWDAHLIDAAVARAQRRIWRPDLGMFEAQSLTSWLDAQIQAQIKEEPILTEPEKPATGRPLGGMQG